MYTLYIYVPGGRDAARRQHRCEGLRRGCGGEGVLQEQQVAVEHSRHVIRLLRLYYQTNNTAVRV